MAISDQITRLRNKIEEQRDLIAELDAAVDALPEAGSGGTDIETCTLTREDHESSYPIAILATQCIDNKITVNKYTSDPADLPFVIENIVKNSLVCIEHVTKNSDAL